MPYLTPEDLPPDFVCRRLLIPASSDWLAIVSGAVTELSKPWNWEQFGSVTVEEALEAMQVMIDEYYAGTCGADGLAPYWDEPDGADATGDDEATGFPWYEDLADWVVTAFLATSFTPEAAVQFVTTARQIRLWFRTRDYGAIARIFIDEELVGEVDTYSAEAGLREWFWNIPNTGGEFAVLDAPTWTLRIEHSGEVNENAVEASDGYAIEIIRKRIQWTLNQEGNIGISRRYNDDLDRWQISVDGENWVDSPDDDPRRHPQLPPLSGATARCDSAATIVELLRQLVNTLIEQMTLGRDVTFITALFLQVLALIGWIAFFVSLIVLLVAAAIALGIETVEAAFTEEVWDDLLCIFYCHMDHNGQLSDVALAAVKSEVAALGGVPATLLGYWLEVMGRAGVNDARAVVGVQEGDCSECDDCEQWCFYFDFSTGQHGWTAVNATYVSGVGFQNPGSGAFPYTADIALDTTGTSITQITIEAQSTTSSTGAFRGVYYAGGSNNVGGEQTGAYIINFGYEPPLVKDAINAQVSNLPANSGTNLITGILMRGLGENPFGDDNCE